MTKYTSADDEVIISLISKHPDNIHAAIEMAAKRLNKSYNGVFARYYKKIRKSNVTIFSTISKDGYAINVKNSIRHGTKATMSKTDIFIMLYGHLTQSEKMKFLLNLV